MDSRRASSSWIDRLVVQNTGWLPTYVTKKALENKIVCGVICEIELPEEATLRSGKMREEIGQFFIRSQHYSLV